MPGRRNFLLMLPVATLAFGSIAEAAELQEGKDYVRLKNPQPVESGKRIEVIEFFSYGCPHCAELEPHLAPWVKGLPADVQFRRVPVIFQPRWETLAKIFYTLDAMGLDGKHSPQVFDAIHRDNQPLHQEKTFFEWVPKVGLDRAKVEDVFKSFAVGSKVARSKSLAQAYNIQSVPTLIVDGKFVTGSDKVGHNGVAAALDALIAKSRTERPKG